MNTPLNNTSESPRTSIREHLGAEGHLIIAGPCSAETEAQVMQTARALAQTPKVHLFRAGIWKPRTRPNSFEGVGVKGLPWLQKVKAETGLRCTIEVANAEHVELALKHGIDVLWVGARTSVNPFSVQEIADALRGVDVPVLVKNPINPDLDLWIGALERLHGAGINKLAAVHRGFTTTDPQPFRNAPQWELPIKLKTLVPDLEIIADPSHIAGHPDLLPLIAQKALDLSMDGLMVEVHPTPAQAWSDPTQQLKPKALASMLNNLVFRRHKTNNPAFNSALDVLRGQIDDIDEQVLQHMAARMRVSQEIGLQKIKNSITVVQPGRWQEVVADRTALGNALGLSDEFLTKLLDLIHQESIRQQNSLNQMATTSNP